MIVKTLALLIFYFLIFYSVIGYGYIFSTIINKSSDYKLTGKFQDYGLIGIFGLVAKTIISYSTILIFPHNYLHNIIILFFCLILFIYFLIKTKKKNFFLVNLILLLFFIALIVQKNHDDFYYYHFWYSLSLTENKIQLGLGNLDHGYKHHSSIFFLNSLFFLPFIKFYLFHLSGLLVLLFFNLVCIGNIIQNINLKIINPINFLYLIFFVYINIKFSRIADYGTDLQGQLLLIIAFIKIIELFFVKKNLNNYQFEFKFIFLIIIYAISLKSYFIINLIIIPLLIYIFGYKFFFRFINKIYLFFLILIGLFPLLSNFFYTGCFLYPLAFTCFENFSWALDIGVVKKLSVYYEIWSKSLSNPNFRAENPEILLKNFQWVNYWLKDYFIKKFIDEFFIILFVCIIFLIFFYKGKKIKSNININFNYYYIPLIFFFIIWFLYHPALRYGGYYLLSFLIFLPTIQFLCNRKFEKKYIKNSILTLLIIAILVFQIKNYARINYEFKRYDFSNFPFFYFKEDTSYKKIDIGDGIYVSVASSSCMGAPTICLAGGIGKLKGKKYLGYNFYIIK
jgi:hypothetical protein